MICCEEGEEYTPYGRTIVKKHPSYENKKNNEEWWTVVENKGLEEELYIHNRTAVWSRGQFCTSSFDVPDLVDCSECGDQLLKASNPPDDVFRQNICTLTVESPIKQALFTTFYTYPDHPAMLGDPVPDQPTGQPIFSLCILEQEFLTVYTEEGDEYTLSLPFLVEKAWPIWYGLLLQRKLDKQEPDPPNPLLFSLLHPLDEISPINQKTGSNNGVLPSYGTDLQASVIMTSNFPSLTVTHSGLHNSVSVWRTRRCNMEENAAMVNNCSFAEGNVPASLAVSQSICNPPFNLQSICNPPFNLQSLHQTLTPSQSITHPPFYSPVNFTPSGHHQTAPFTPMGTPFTPQNKSVLNSSLLNLSLPGGASPLTPARRSPIVTTVKTPVNARLRSVLACPDKLTPHRHSSLVHFGTTPSPSLLCTHPPKADCTSSPIRTPRSTIRRLPAHSVHNETMGEVDPIIPDICLELLWTDQTATKPTKAFLTEDLVGQHFLCLVFSNFIRLIKYELTNDLCSLVFGTCSTLSVRDAAPLPALDMFLVIDNNGCLSLYSGLQHVSKVHITQSSQAFNATLFKDFSCLNISCKAMKPSTPLRRSSLIAGNKASAVPDLKLNVMLSPVVSVKDPPCKPFVEWNIAGEARCLRDSTLQCLTVVQESGVMNRIKFPDIWTCSLVNRILAAFKHILPRPCTLDFMAKWFCSRNSPGCEDSSSHGEWLLFSRTLLTMIGYDTDKLQAACPLDSTPSVAKKLKMADNGSDKDWEYLLSSQYHREVDGDFNEALELSWPGTINADVVPVDCNLNSSAPLFSHMPAIFFCLHLLYEELKGCRLYWNSCSLLVPCLSQLAADLRLPLYLHHYWKDFPTICSPRGPVKHLSESQLTLLPKPSYFCETPPNFMATLLQVIKEEIIEPFPYIPEVCPLIKSILLIHFVARHNYSLDDIPFHLCLQRISLSGLKVPDPLQNLSMLVVNPDKVPSIHEKVVLLMDSLGLNNLDVKLLAPGLSLLFMNSRHLCGTAPPLDWQGQTYQLINRPDLLRHSLEASAFWDANLLHSQDAYLPPHQYDGFKNDENSQQRIVRRNSPMDGEDDSAKDGMDKLDWDLMRMRWPFDKRIKDVRHMLDSATHARIDVPASQGIELSDQELQEEQNRMLFAISLRTMALPIGRGMFTMSTLVPVITEAIPIPPLTLSGKSAQRGNTIDLSSIEVPPNMNTWPLFHNGVATSLRIHPNSKDLDSSWILFNKTKTENDFVLEHGGFLLGLGLTGHLRSLSTIVIHEYLSRTNELTTVGLLLGLAVARRGTCHAPTTKLLSIHLECLLPPTCVELNIHHSVQVSCILGVGLLYQGSGHRHMAEVLLREIGRPPGPEMENSSDRESYSLAAGMGLGLVMLGKGANPDEFADLNIAGQLYHFIEGGYQKPMSGPTRDKYKYASYQIKEGQRVNIDVTSPGATMALGMIYFGSNNRAIAKWMMAPGTPYLLDQIRSDFLLLRTIALGLIMWDEVVPSIAWVEGNVPPLVLRHVSNCEEVTLEEPNIDLEETMYQAFFNLVTGSCVVLALKFAGSANEDAFDVIHKYTVMIHRFSRNSNVTVVAGRSVIESCLCLCVLCLAMVMAGSGDLEVLQIIRMLRERVSSHSSSPGYGSNMALHMALGFLFLGGGRFTLGTSQLSVAALLISCFPKFPHHSADNRYHLQAFRHLYVIACEPRLLMPVDVETGALCRAKISFRFIGGVSTDIFEDFAPLMLPELDKLEEVIIESNSDLDRYWPVKFSQGKNMRVLEALLKSGCGVALKLRDGEAPYPALVHSSPDCPDRRMFLPSDKLAVKTGTHQLPLSWVAQSAKLMGIDGEKAANLLFFLLGIDISQTDSLRSTLLLDFDSSIIEEESLVPSSEEDEDESSLHLSEMKSPHFKESHINPSHFEESHINPSHFEKSHINPSHFEESHINPRVLQQLFRSVVCDSMALGKPEGVISWITVIMGMKKISNIHLNSGLLVWQVKLFHGISNFLSRLAKRSPASESAMEVVEAATEAPRQFVSPDQAISLRCRLMNIVDCWSEDVNSELVSFLKSTDDDSFHFSPKTAITLLVKDVPHPSLLKKGLKGKLQIAKELHRLGISSAIIQSIVSPVAAF